MPPPAAMTLTTSSLALPMSTPTQSPARISADEDTRAVYTPGTNRLRVAGAEPLFVETVTGPFTPVSRLMTLPDAEHSTR